MSLDKYYSCEIVQVDPDILTRVQFNKTVGDSIGGKINLTNEGNQKRALIVTAPVTHAMRLTNNKGLYQPRRMINGIKSFVSSYSKPVLVEHNENLAPIGRVLEASYESIPHHFLQDQPEAFTHEDTFALIKYLMSTGLIYDPNFPGVGQGILSMSINDKDAIEKFLDTRYLTFSIQVSSNELYDPHTGKPFKNFFEEEKDGDEEKYSPHRPGQEVDGMPGFIVLDQLFYKEVSVVNMPADELAVVRNIQTATMADSNSKKPIITIHSTPKIFKENGNYAYTDSKISELKKEGDNNNMPPDIKAPVEQTDNKPPINEVLDNTKVFDFTTITDTSNEEETYNALSLVLEEMGFADAKLTSEQRKALPGSVFCGSGRSFPANDCAHVLAGKRLLGRASLSSSAKARVLSCLNRKGKTLGCEDTTDSTVTKDSFSPQQVYEKMDNMSDYDIIDFANDFLAKLSERDLDVLDLINLQKFSDKKSNDSQSVMIQLKELENEKKELLSQVDSLLKEAKSYGSLALVLSKSITDNLKIENIKDAVETHKEKSIDDIKKEVNLIIEDSKLTSKLDALFSGKASEVNVADKVDNPALQSGEATVNSTDDLIMKVVSDKYIIIKNNDGKSYADRYILDLAKRGYITQDSANKFLSTHDAQ